MKIWYRFSVLKFGSLSNALILDKLLLLLNFLTTDRNKSSKDWWPLPFFTIVIVCLQTLTTRGCNCKLGWSMLDQQSTFLLSLFSASTIHDLSRSQRGCFVCVAKQNLRTSPFCNKTKQTAITTTSPLALPTSFDSSHQQLTHTHALIGSPCVFWQFIGRARWVHRSLSLLRIANLDASHRGRFARKSSLSSLFSGDASGSYSPFSVFRLRVWVFPFEVKVSGTGSAGQQCERRGLFFLSESRSK